MYCAECGNQLPVGTNACATCGTPAEVAPTPSTNELSKRVQERSQDALKAFKTIAVNPVGGLAATFQALERRQAMEVGVVFAVVFELSQMHGGEANCRVRMEHARLREPSVCQGENTRPGDRVFLAAAAKCPPPLPD